MWRTLSNEVLLPLTASISCVELGTADLTVPGNYGPPLHPQLLTAELKNILSH